MKIGIFKNIFISLPLAILIGLFFSYKIIKFSDNEVFSRQVILKKSPEFFDRFKRGGYYELESADNHTFKVDYESFKKLKEETHLRDDFKHLKKGDTILIKYLNLSRKRKNVRQPYFRVVHLEFKNEVIINEKDVQKSDKKSYFILVTLISLILIYGLYKEFRDYRLFKSLNS